MSVRLFLGNLPYSATEADVRAHVAAVAPPVSVVLPMDRETGRPRGFAFVDYADLTTAAEVIRRLNGQPFLGRTLSVSEARPREERGPRPPMGMGVGSGGMAPRGNPFAPPGGDMVGRPRERNFGPPAPPKGKPTRGGKGRGDGGPKGPIKVRGGGRVYDVDDRNVEKAADEPFDDFATSLPGEDVATNVPGDDSADGDE
ncbi:MAG: RNA-binding protein [Acidobacteria bacterium]|nr:RNA-binding protein [Acidobacteriota bacterium]